tara:strand:- start:683 stop:916 length:234 start_codon:yes stop_codon:yes gene_type:complete
MDNMNLDIFILGGYGPFVWSAFIFTFVSCFFLYLKTKKEFKKQEKIFFSIFKQPKTLSIKVVDKKNSKEAFSKGQIF